MDEKIRDPKAFINYSNHSSQELCWEVCAALFAQVNVSQHSLCLAMPQELQQAQDSLVQANLPALLWVPPKVLLPVFSC